MARKIFSLYIFFVFAFSISSVCESYAQQSNEHIKALADSAAKSFTWDVQKVEKGALMYLDVPFQRGDSIAYLTLTVAKMKGTDRPDVISIMVPSPAKKENGLYFMFSKTVRKDGKFGVEPDTSSASSIGFIDCNSEFCTARIKDGYIIGKTKEAKTDVFREFLKYDHVWFLYFDSTGHQSVSVPLFSFKKQYKELE
ncbi:MAG TPA: hypothetical protein VEW28_09285 [Candidatus Kapabacteria bacterium]|nr:hypothetical protein [Candidatus Kapabacteria bacterium]